MASDKAVDVKDLAARFSPEALLDLVRQSGKKVTGHRCQCPLDGCRDKGREARLNAQVQAAKERGKGILHCWACNGRGDYVDVYQAVRGVDFKAALEQLRDQVPAPAKPDLRLVRGTTSDAKKLKPEEVRKLWNELVAKDDIGETYLEGRRLHEAVELGHVRFATELLSDPLRYKANNNYRPAMLLSSLAGDPVGLQFRAVVPCDAAKKVRGLKGSNARRGYFGRPADVLGSRCVVVTEGFADTAAALLWTKDQADTAVIGVPGVGFVPGVADALQEFGVDVRGQLWVLLAQHDVGPQNKSLGRFQELKMRLQQAGADVVLEAEPPGDVKDWAEAWEREQLGEWPPAQVRRFLGGNSDSGETGMTRASGVAIWHAETVAEPEYLGKDLRSLEFLLSADVHRTSVCGPGDWRLNEMTDEVEYGGAPLGRGDYTRIRLHLENYKGSMNGQRLKFADADIRSIAYALAERRRYSPVREYLDGLVHDGVDHIARLAQALGLDEAKDGLEGEYLRRWLIAAVARAYQPGCQVDSMLVLQGKEGEHKSRFFEELSGKWFVRMSAELGSKDSVETMRRAWLIELDEMDAVAKTRDFSSVKAFITRPTDVYVPKYVREAVVVKRGSVLGGTVNHEEFLVDEDGLRRFWVIPIRGRIDREFVRANREAIWAQARELYRAKEQWHLPAEFEDLRREANKRFVREDPWAPAVQKYLDDNPIEDFFRPDIILGYGLKMQAKEIDHGARTRIGRILRGLGFVAEMRSEGKHGRYRGFKRPQEER